MRLLLILNLLLPIIGFSQTTSWINEIHYDNQGTDSLEFVEILAISSKLKVYAYNGATGTPYDSVLVDTLAFEEINDTRLHVWYPELLQNGPRDGLCLTRNDTVIHAIAYEKEFIALDGPAAGQTFTDIQVSEDTYTPIGYSLQMTGKGDQVKHFVWKQDSLWTPGALNRSQQITNEPVIYLESPIDTVRFDVTPVGFHSVACAFTIRGSNLNESIRIYPPEGFTIDTSVYFTQPTSIGQYLELTPIHGCLPPTLLYARFEPVNPTGLDQCETLTISNTETEDIQITLCGEEGFYDYPRMWINEFHYDDLSTDTLEFVELAVQHADRYATSDIQLFAYNGSNGTYYRDYPLNEMIAFPTPDPAWNLYVMDIPQLQNGPDGFALCYRDSCHQFLSYEGEFIATNGPAFGQWSSDLGLQEFPDSPNLSSLQLIGEGKQLKDFEWTYTPGTNTRGLPNISQVLNLNLLEMDFDREEENIHLSWKVLGSEYVSEYRLETSSTGIVWDSLASIIPHDLAHYAYSYILDSDHYVRLSYRSFAGESKPLKIIRVSGLPLRAWALTLENVLFAPIPQTMVTLDVLSISGQVIQKLTDKIENHQLALTHWLDELPSGFYLLRIIYPNRPVPKFLRFSR